MAKEIIIEYNPDGTVRMEAEGFEGLECLEATAPYEKALGMKKENSKRKIKTFAPKGGVRLGSQHRIQTRR